jgi:acylphosphatase
VTQLCLHGYVSGQVQGVSFRAFARRQALQAQVRGWARNLDDGRVEVLLCGEPDAVQQVVEALHRGPPHAVVTAVTLQPTTWTDTDGFAIG